MAQAMQSTPAPEEAIRFAIVHSWLGHVLVAVSDAGLAALLIGDEEMRLIADLRRIFTAARLVRDEVGLADTLVAVDTFLQTPSNGLALALDLRGTVTEQAIWEALREVPAGETTTYGRIAKRLTVPTTAQEVGAACAANILAVAVPCHRVVKADGSISGYRWGVHRKRRLINREAIA